MGEPPERFLADHLLEHPRLEADVRPMATGDRKPREDVVVADCSSFGIDVDKGTADAEHGDHLLATLGDDEGVRLARRL